MKENSIFFPLIVVIFLATLMAYGVSWYVKSNGDLSSAITQEQLASFTNENVEYVELPPVGADNIYSSPVESRQKQAVRYDNIGQAVKTLNIGNIATATPEDLHHIGETNWSLTNTVNANLDFPQVIEVVFNNRNVMDGFFSRKDVLNLTENYLNLIDLLDNDPKTVSGLIEGHAFKSVLQNQDLMAKLLDSALMQELLLSRTATYFLDNPDEAKRVIEKNEILAPLLKEEKLKSVLLNNPITQDFALEVFPPTN